jgi:hypothetical protein
MLLLMPLLLRLSLLCLLQLIGRVRVWADEGVPAGNLASAGAIKALA